MTAGAPYFADTAFWIALSLQGDQFHQRARNWQARIQRTATRIVTTEAVLWEWMNALSGQSTRAFAARGYRAIQLDSRIDVVGWDAASNEQAIRLYESRPDKDWSLTDCLSFTVMADRRLSQALTSDRHFAQAGYEALLLMDHS